MNPIHILKEVLLPDWACRRISGTRGDRGHHRFDSMPINLYCWTLNANVAAEG